MIMDIMYWGKWGGGMEENGGGRKGSNANKGGANAYSVCL